MENGVCQKEPIEFIYSRPCDDSPRERPEIPQQNSLDFLSGIALMR
jgi:hypothetical protein